MHLTIYQYNTCGTCRNAVKFLEAHGIEYKSIPIRETPPSAGELRRMLKQQGGNIRKLFNVSGQDYKRLKLKESLPTMTEDDAINLLASNGNLVKRPFVLTKTAGLVGFNEPVWREALGIK